MNYIWRVFRLDNKSDINKFKKTYVRNIFLLNLSVLLTCEVSDSIFDDSLTLLEQLSAREGDCGVISILLWS